MKNRPFHQRMGFAIAGIISSLRSEKSFRIEMLAAVTVLVALAWLQPAPVWWALIAMTVAMVLAAELINTSIERLTDHLHPDRHPEIKAVKDCAAGAVLIASLAALAVAAALAADLLL